MKNIYGQVYIYGLVGIYGYVNEYKWLYGYVDINSRYVNIVILWVFMFI